MCTEANTAGQPPPAFHMGSSSSPSFSGSMLVSGLGEAVEDGLRIWALAVREKDLDEASGSCLQSGSVLAKLTNPKSYSKCGIYSYTGYYLATK